MITSTRLEAFLEVMSKEAPDRWVWAKEDEVGRKPFWRVGCQTSYPPFQFLIEFNDEMLYAQYKFRDFRIRSSCWSALYRVLLRLNEELSLVKFGLDDFGVVTMMGEIPTAQCSLETFRNLMELMVYYLEQFYWEIGIVAESPSLAPWLVEKEAQLDRLDREFQSVVEAVHIENAGALPDTKER